MPLSCCNRVKGSGCCTAKAWEQQQGRAEQPVGGRVGLLQQWVSQVMLFAPFLSADPSPPFLSQHVFLGCTDMVTFEKKKKKDYPKQKSCHGVNSYCSSPGDAHLPCPSLQKGSSQRCLNHFSARSNPLGQVVLNIRLVWHCTEEDHVCIDG